MTNSTGIRLLLVLVALTGFAAAVGAFRIPLHATIAAGNGQQAPHSETLTVSFARVDSIVVAGDVFRADRRAAPIAYEPARAADGPPPPIEPAPRLSLAGVVLGRSRAALLRGIPGAEGVRVLGEGESVGEIWVLHVSDTVAVVRWRTDTLHLALGGGGS